MKVRQLSPTGDYRFGGNSNDFLVNTPEAVAQVVQTSLQLWLGEWYLDLTDGTAYPEGVLGKHSKDQADATIVARIQQCQGVVNVIDYTSTIDETTRAYSSSSAKINTIYGVTTVELSNRGNF